MTKPLGPDRSEVVFQDYKPALTEAHAIAEANRCLFCHDAPCIQACPTEIDIPQFIRKITTGNVRGSARTILESNILGTSCARVCPVEVLCVGACVYNAKGEPPIQIGKLQRYSTDKALEAGWRFFEAGPDTGKSVGLVGAGPASLACAHELRRLGHRATIYEKRAVTGGLNVTGVAPYKLRADDAVREVEYVLKIGGIDVQEGVEVGVNVGLAELEQRHDAMFIGFGLGPDSRLRIQGELLDGVHGAVDYIERLKLGRVDLSKVRTAVVVGGGNTALDAIRELKGLGVPDVVMLYRGQEPSMSGYHHEWEAAKIEGCRALWGTLPVGFEGTGAVTGIRCVKVDENKRAIDGTEHVVPADLVLLAIGQSKLGELLAAIGGFTLDKGRIVVDAEGFTGRPRWFAGGDAANGGKEVVNAVAEGQAAARAIHRMLMGSVDA